MTVTVGLARSTGVDDEPRQRYDSYRMLARFDSGRASVDVAMSQFGDWLRARKGIDVDVAEQGSHRLGDSDVLVLQRDDSNGRTGFGRLTERRPDGTFVTDLTAHHHGSDAWLALRVAADSDRRIDVPWVARYLTQVMDLRDGGCSLTVRPRVVGGTSIDDVLDAICDPDRRGLQLVAGTNEEGSFEEFRARIERITRGVVGLASVLVLDPAATAAVADALGPTHWVPAWTLRTFLPGADPAGPADGRRHRMLSASRIYGSTDIQLERLIGGFAKAQVFRTPLPADVTRVFRRLARVEDRLILDVHSATVPTQRAQPAIVAPETSAWDREVLSAVLDSGVVAAGQPDAAAAVRRSIDLGLVAEEFASAVEELAEKKQQTIDELLDRLSELRTLYENSQLETAAAQEDAADRQDEVRWLRGQLREARSAMADMPLPAEERTRYPEDFRELLTMVGALEERGVVYCGDADTTLDLDEVDTLGSAVREAWTVLLLLCDYVRCKRDGYGQGLDGFVRCAPDGAMTYPYGKFAPTETARTMKDFGEERKMPVPADLSSTGFLIMQTHFKLASIGMVSPRLYLFDDVTDSGKVYVGYIGRHLRNSQTN